MKIAKKTFILLMIYLIAAILTLGGFLYVSCKRAEDAERHLKTSYSHAFAGLSSSMNGLSDSLRKLCFAGTPAMTATLCANAYSEASSAASLLARLPYSNIELEKTATFIGTAADYLDSIHRAAAAGSVRTDEESDNLAALSESASLLAEQLGTMQLAVLSGEITLESIDVSREERSDPAYSGDDSFISGIEDIESGLGDLPAFSYDGALSVSVPKSAKALAGLSDISESGALSLAAKLTGKSEDIFSAEYVREDSIPVYVLRGETENAEYALEITRQGGKLMRLDTLRDFGEARLTREECLGAAEAFLQTLGYGQFKCISADESDKETVLRFAASEGSIICYPDEVKVSVARDTGEIVGFDGLGYITYHTERTFNAADMTEEAARSVLSPLLTVNEVGEALIHSAGKNELYCYEFRCTGPDGERCTVYVNRATCAEELILIGE